MEIKEWIKEHPIWTGIIGICGVMFLVMIITPNTNDCNCPSTEVLDNKFIVMCEMYNTEVELINELMDYVDNYANPGGIVLTRQINADCYDLLNK